jgi:hypothetical protein
VTPGGHVEPDFASGSWTDSLGGMALDPGANALYVSREPPLHGPAPLTAHVVRSDGRLAITGYADLCVASPVVIPIAPLLAVRGSVFGAAYLDKDTVCSWEGPRLAPRANLGLAASLGAALSPVDETMAALLALAGDVRTRRGTYLRTDLRLLSMENGGGVALLATLELPSRVRQVLFHPSGRFLYAADEDATLWTYSIGSGGRLEPIERLPDAAHASDPDSDIHTPPPFMAVCVRAGTSPQGADHPSLGARLRCRTASTSSRAAVRPVVGGGSGGSPRPQGPTRHSTIPADWRGRSCASTRRAVVVTGRKVTRLNWSRATPYAASSAAGCHALPSQ